MRTTLVNSSVPPLGVAKAALVFCRKCEERIPQKRLDAVPGAKYCRDCQGSRDLSPVEQFGDLLERVGVVRGEGDGEHRVLGGSDYLGGIGL